MLDVKVSFDSPEAIDTAALATWAFEAGPDARQAALGDVLAALDLKAGGRLQELAAAGELTGKPGETLLLHQLPGLKARRLLLLGAGKPEKFAPGDIRTLAGAAARFLKARGVTQFAFLVRVGTATDAAQAAVEGVCLANFEPARYQTDRKEDKAIAALTLAGFPAGQQQGVEAAARRGRILGEAQNFTRELVNEPSNRLTPRLFAERAAQMARELGLEADILDEARLRELKMGAFLSVAQGSEEPPRLVVLTYTPPAWRSGAPARGEAAQAEAARGEAPQAEAVLGLVGKGITFDSGGISIKPGEGMEKMKYDMAGGATMLGTMRAIAQLKPAQKVIAVIPLTENLPSGRAQKPGDVQVAMSGKSIEVVNTDAEGRLVLADALHYARQLGATHLIDAATLTGAIVTALGHVHAGAFTNNQKFFDAFQASAAAAGERFWPMPLDDDYAENIKSEIADLRNTGKGRGGGAINGAMFLREFVGDAPWIHLDIAGTAWLEEARPGLAKGPSGVAVRTLVHFIENFRG